MRLHRIATTVVALSALGGAYAPTAAAEATPKNGLSIEAFRENALTTNPDALDKLRKYPLANGLVASGTVDGSYMNQQLHDPRAQAVMTDLVKCALGRGSSVTYVDGHPGDGIGEGKTHVWEGELGLCQQKQADIGDWSQAAPTTKCLQLVTSCLMARVNALHMAIPISPRGEPSLLPLRTAVDTQTRLRASSAGEDPSQGRLIGSFDTSCGDRKECNWTSGYVGTCAQGTVQLMIQSPQMPPNCGSASVRICAGIHGCLSTPDASIEQLPYSKHIADHGDCAAAIDFSCPADVGTAGYFSVMFRPGGVRRIVPRDATTRYPATERDVFGFREGAFFGNLFDPSAALMVRCAVADGVATCNRVAIPFPPRFPAPLALPYQNVYACYDSDLPKDLAVAYLNARICAFPAGDGYHESCFYHPPMPCRGGGNPPQSPTCTWQNGTEYQSCHGQTATETYPAITTYLNDPCDLIGGGPLCTQLRGAVASAPASLVPVGPGPRGCGGCSSGVGAALPPASLAMLVALVLGRRRKRDTR